jgi:hypothetical protein
MSTIDAAIEVIRRLREEIGKETADVSVIASSQYELTRMLVSLENLRHITRQSPPVHKTS